MSGFWTPARGSTVPPIRWYWSSSWGSHVSERSALISHVSCMLPVTVIMTTTQGMLFRCLSSLVIMAWLRSSSRRLATSRIRRPVGMYMLDYLRVVGQVYFNTVPLHMISSFVLGSTRSIYCWIFNLIVY
jgi:hypothetical protein